ncbi:MAG: ABC transporter substrate-binding protein [Alphaproteobacteria bacterium]|nr:ABC transporter substrate-binding protein [Alphaproteobacteria bacterium]
MRLRRRKFMAGSAGASAAATYLPSSSGMAQAQAQRTLIVAAQGTPEGLDGDALKGNTQACVVQCYEGLTRYGRTERNGRPYLDPTRIEGHLAESWTVSPDGKRYVFKLRQGLRSARGNELTAEDVEWSWNKSFAQKRTGNFIAVVSNVVPNGVKALSKYEVEFNLAAPSAIFLNALTLYVPGIYDTTEVKRHVTADDPWALKWIDQNVAAFGAYHMSELRPGEQAVFTANPNYFRDKPYFDRVVFRAVPSAGSRLTLLKSRQVQWIERPSTQQITDLRNDRNVKVQDTFGRAMSSIRMNAGLKPFDDVRVRRALNHAINRQTIIQSIYFGLAEEARSIVPPALGGYDPSHFKYPYDVARAKALLAEAGYPNGFETELLYGSEYWWDEPLCVQIADQLKAVGVTAKPTKITLADLRARGAINRMDMPFFAFEDGPIVLDPVYCLFLLAHTQGVSNRAKYSSAALDKLIDEGRQTLDREKRYTLMSEAQKIWMDDAPWLLTVYPTLFEAMATNIVGWCPHPDDHERWVDLKTA